MKRRPLALYSYVQRATKFSLFRAFLFLRNGFLFNIWRLLNSEHALINIIMTFELIVPEILIFKWKESGSEIPILQRNLHNK
jgi:hypothetical protein